MLFKAIKTLLFVKKHNINDEETFKQIILEKNALYRSEALKILKQHSDDLKSKKLTS